MSKKEESMNRMQLRLADLSSRPVVIKLGLEDSDKEIRRGLLRELKKTNNSLKQIFNLLQKK